MTLLTVTAAAYLGAPAIIGALLGALAAVAVGVAVTKIEWAERVWNPTTGCTRVSPGCDLCYMFAEVENRLQHRVPGAYAHGTRLTLHPRRLGEMEAVKTPSKVFVDSMSDLLHESVPDEYVFEVFEAMARAPWHLYMVLTKRDRRLRELGPSLPWADHVMMGVSVESAAYVHRIDALRASGATRTFVSLEPLIGPVVDPDRGLDLSRIDYVIAGGESDKYDDEEQRDPVPLDPQWVRDIRDACREQRTAFNFKQWGAFDEHGDPVGKKKAGRELDGRTHDEEPEWFWEFMRKAGVRAAAARLGRSVRGAGSAPGGDGAPGP